MSPPLLSRRAAGPEPEAEPGATLAGPPVECGRRDRKKARDAGSPADGGAEARGRARLRARHGRGHRRSGGRRDEDLLQLLPLEGVRRHRRRPDRVEQMRAEPARPARGRVADRRLACGARRLRRRRSPRSSTTSARDGTPGSGASASSARIPICSAPTAPTSPRSSGAWSRRSPNASARDPAHDPYPALVDGDGARRRTRWQALYWSAERRRRLACRAHRRGHRQRRRRLLTSEP